MSDEWLHAADDSFVNPEPIVLEESDAIINDFLSPSKLQELAGEDDLSNVALLEMMVDTRETTLGNFGQYLPALTQLKLSDSMVPSVRDIGTSLHNLQVLWMSRCGLSDIDGIASMQNLKELYIAFNNISDVSPLSFLESLEVVDLEGNKIVDVEQLDYLAIMSNLSTLTLTGNPLCQSYQSQIDQFCSFQELVLRKVTQLQSFNDNEPASKDIEGRPSTAMSSQSQEDIDLITNAIKEGILGDEDIRIPPSLTLSSRSNSPITSVFKQAISTRVNRPRPATAGARRTADVSSPESRMLIPSPQGRPGSSGSESGMLQQDDSSSLTFGDPICGNPILALRNRKKTSMPLMSFLKDERGSISRPATAIGVRNRPSKVNTDKQTNLFFKDILETTDISSSENVTTKEPEKNTNYFTISSVNEPTIQIPSPPTSNKPTFKSPTPPATPLPRSPQRPQTASDFRAMRYRRSFPIKSGSSSVNVMTLNSVSSSIHSNHSLQKEIKDST